MNRYEEDAHTKFPFYFLEGVPVGRGSNMSVKIPCDF